MLADIPQRRRTQHGVHHRVGQHIGVRVAQQALFKGDLHAAQDQLAAFHQAVHVITMSNAHSRFLFLYRAGQVLPRGDLQVGIVTLGELHRAASELEQAAVIGDQPGFFGVQFLQGGQILRPVKALGRLHRIQGTAVRGAVHKAGFRHRFAVTGHGLLDGVLDRHCRGGGSAAGSGFQHRRDDGRAHKGPGCVVHGHQLPVGCQHAILGALGAGGTTGHDLHRLGAADGLLLHESTVFARHQHDLADLRALVKSADAAVQHRFTAQVKAELVEPHPGGRTCRHQHGRNRFLQSAHLPLLPPRRCFRLRLAIISHLLL